MSSAAAPANELILGRYRALRPLGSGGMGHVWLVRDERSGLDVALKIVTREGKSGARAEREARAAASLKHERCQRILSLARDYSHVYIAYEYIPGRTLREALRAGELDDRDAVEVAAQICDALAHAHAKGIIHRDVKPSNVLLAEVDDIDVRLLDFGLAQMREFDTLTAHGDIPGTLAYISPERLLGQPATPAADVWGVGVVLWEAFAGRHPFWGGDLVETSRLIQTGAPALETVRPDLPPHVLRMVTSALVANPQRRPGARELARELRSTPKARKQKSSSGPAQRPAATAPAVTSARVLPAGLAAASAGWVSATLPFYPTHWSIAIAATAAALGFVAPRAALAFVLGVAFFPLANISVGLAALYAVLAVALFLFSWRDARSGLLLAAGPLLAPLGALGALPLVAQLARGRARRGVQAGVAVLLAALVAGVRHARLPFVHSLPPLGLGIDGSRSATAVGAALIRQLQAQPVLLWEAVVIAIAAVALPYARRRGPWVAAGFGTALLAATALTAPATAVLPLVATAWLTAAVLALET
ncbi:MAG TPA: serine/threonine-protein kinase [Gaiellaceae bacterium]